MCRGTCVGPIEHPSGPSQLPSFPGASGPPTDLSSPGTSLSRLIRPRGTAVEVSEVCPVFPLIFHQECGKKVCGGV